jgi:hypothetical protein
VKIGTHRIEVDEKGVIASTTFELSPGTRVHQITPERNPRWLVLDIPGHKRFGGQGQFRPYEQAKFWVLEIVDIDAGSSIPGHFIYEVDDVLTVTKRR